MPCASWASKVGKVRYEHLKVAATTSRASKPIYARYYAAGVAFVLPSSSSLAFLEVE